MLYYLLTCLLGAAASIALYTFFHRRYHERNLATADYVENCNRYRYESHGRTFKILIGLIYIPFLLAFISPRFLEYGGYADGYTLYYKNDEGRYVEVGFAVWDHSPILRVPPPTAWNNGRTKFSFVVERDGRMRHATILVGFRYPQDPEEFAKIPEGLRHINMPYSDYPPEVATHMRQFLRFVVENDDNIKYNLASINSASKEELVGKFRERLNGILANQSPPFGIRAEIVSVNVQEF